MHSREEQMAAFGRLLDVMDDLREKCPWDRVQTNETLRPNTIEEVYELSDALLNDDDMNICKELGDVLLHVVFYAKIGSEKGEFDIADVCDKLCQKLIYRHPHIYGEVKVDGTEKVLNNWEELKLKEKDGNKRTLSGVPNSLPSLIKAFRIQEKARNVGFDWADANGAWDKLAEEFSELREAIAADAAAHPQKEGDRPQLSQFNEVENEYGDVLFAAVNVGRLSGLNPDSALEHTNQKFTRRFNYMEEKAIQQGRKLREMTLDEMDVLWEEAKALEGEKAKGQRPTDE
ncbi:MAG: nucleoside triphosphate pyrophosphohydrolase [Bacteroidaceae bacterium]|nr:nucleoside triphosphate pyrophosphohydrolase [Bacteroidaceae bacterium]